jgi:putative hydrolase of the HAD superfamily
VFFDLDDTLCAYWDAAKAGLRRAFEEHGPPGVPVETMVRHWAAAFRHFSPALKESRWYDTYLKCGEPTRTEQMRLALLEAAINDPERAKLLGDAYAVARDRALQLFPDAIEVLEWLQPRFPLGLITNGPADVQRQEIITLGIQKYFDHILIEGEMGEGKPLQSVFRHAERLVRLKPEQILFVGNSYHHDIEPAILAGWFTVWVRRASDVPPSARDQSKPPELRPEAAPPDAAIGDLRELVGLLSG